VAPPRVVDPTGTYHINSTGNFGEELYLSPVDRSAFLDLYARVVRKRSWVTYAYCLMTTHFHCVVRLVDGGLSEGMREINGCFSRRMNAITGRTGKGHLFRNRFHAVRIAGDAHLLESCRYVVNNPVMAGMCSQPAEWGWSSYGASAGLCSAPAFLAVDELLGLFGSNPEASRVAYCAFVSDGLARWSDQRNEAHVDKAARYRRERKAT
jgi:REP-associated tyrosine transposase